MGVRTGGGMWRNLLRAGVGLSLMLGAVPANAETPWPSVIGVAGKPNLIMGASDLPAFGYRMDEFFLSGTATSYQLPGAVTPDGQWDATPAGSAPYATRVVVVRPEDPAKFNGTVLVEWLNVTGGQDTPADWMVAHREILRRGYAYVALSAQKVGIEGGDAVMGAARGVKKVNPERYGTLSHPGDAFAYDIFSQGGAALKAPGASGLLGPLAPARVLAIGESQSASFLTTYLNAVDRLARVYDGFFVHSRWGSSSALDGAHTRNPQSPMPQHVRFRKDLRVPVLTMITETDLVGAGISGYHASRRPEDKLLRVWEVAGSAHADNYMFMGAFIDSGVADHATLAPIFVPTTRSIAGKLDKPSNPGMTHHYVAQAAITALDGWVRTGKAPAKTQPLALASGGKEGVEASFALDANGIAKGGVRTPWVDVPAIRISGVGNSGSFVAKLTGVGERFDKATLARLYPGGKADYLKRFEQSLDKAIGAGHVLREDREEILAIAAINFDTAP